MQQTGLTAQAVLAALAQQLTGRRAEAAIRMTAAQAQTTVQRIQQLIHPVIRIAASARRPVSCCASAARTA